MRRPLLFVLGAIGIFVSLVFLENYSKDGLNALKIGASGRSKNNGQSIDGRPVVTRGGETIRIASFNIQVFGESKLGKAAVMGRLARIARMFDVIAIQEVRSKHQDVLPVFCDLINEDGAHYDFVVGPRLGNTDSKEQYAFIFDTASVEVDRTQLYTVEDPNNLLHREPLVAWFRVRGPPTDQAFTFSLVNIHTDPDVAAKEISVLDDVFQAVVSDGRQEDDVIMLGDFNADDRHFGQLAQLPGVVCVISDKMTNTLQTHQYDNIVFNEQATREFTGHGGVFDFMTSFRLTEAEALEISDHLPVWAEFSIYEGGVPGRLANQRDDTRTSSRARNSR